MNQYIWIVDAIECVENYQGNANVAVNVLWRCTGTDGQNHYSEIGKQRIQYAPQDGFTPFEQLTSDQVIAWVKSAITADGILLVEAKINDKLFELSHSFATLKQLPWLPKKVEEPQVIIPWPNVSKDEVTK